MTAEEIEKEKVLIDGMSQIRMAFLLRFSPSGHMYFNDNNGDLPDYFAKVFIEKGGMTPDISKMLGWDLEWARRNYG